MTIRSGLYAAALVVFLTSAAVAQSTAPTTNLKIAGMTCGSCAKTLEKVAKKIDGVHSIAVDQSKGTALVTYDAGKTSADQIAKLLTRRSGMKASVQEPSPK
jgi:P-type Cu+ transporter